MTRPEHVSLPDEAPPSLLREGAQLSRPRRLWRRLRALAVLAVDLFPWTPLGLLLAAAASWGLRHYAFDQLDLVWLVVGYATLGLCAVSPLPVLAAAAILTFAHRRSAEHGGAALELETGLEGRGGVALPALRYLPFVQVRWSWLLPLDAEVRTERREGRLLEQVRFESRGRHERIVRRLQVQDPFGLSRIGLRLTQQRPVRVQPRLGGLSHLASLSAYVSGDALPHPLGLSEGDRVELQRYVAGDPARFIHWKLFGRTRKLMVRVPERALSPARRTSAFLLAGPDDDASAALARLALEKNLLGSEWRFATDREPAGTSRRAQALEWVVGSAGAHELAGSGLHAFVDADRARGPQRLLVFAPPVPGPWLEPLVQLARVHAVQVLVGVDGLSASAARPLWQRLLSEPVGASGTPLEPLHALLDELGRRKLPVTVIDRGSGRALGRGQLVVAARSSTATTRSAA
jgi:hypothetical protein